MSGSVATTVSELNVNRYYSLSSFAILYYDYALTLPAEIDHFWTNSRFSWNKILFFINRYLSLIGHVPIIIKTFASLSSQSCRDLQVYHQSLSVLLQMVVSVIMIMRACALYENNRHLLTFLVLLSVVIICLTFWSVFRHSSPDPESTNWAALAGCASTSLSSQSASHIAVAWSCLLAVDSIIFGLTLYKTLNMHCTGLVMVILRDGTMYYALVACANLSNILTLFLGEGPIRGVGTTFANVLATTLISRMMLNLRTATHTPYSSISLRTIAFGDRPPPFSDPLFVERLEQNS